MSIACEQKTTVHVQIAIPVEDVAAAYMLSSIGAKIYKAL